MAREMRHSGIEWIGEIPKEWNIIFLKNTAKGENCLFIDGDWIESPYITDSGYRYLTTGNVGPLKFKEQGNSYISANSFKLLNCTEVFPGDLLIARLNEPIARTCFVPDMGCPIVTAVDNVIYRPNTNLFFKGFMLYMLNCPGFTENANLLARGSTMHRLSRTMLGNMQIISPPLPEQQKIANYLDEVCGEVDEMVALQETMIEELKAYKQSVITEAVTKGLNPDVPMKDSGIDWIGEVPEHWEVVKLSLLTSKIGSGSTPTGGANVYVSEGVKFLRSQNVYFEGLDLTDVAHITEKVDEQMKGTRVLPGDVLLNITGGSIGRCYYVDETLGKANVNQHVSIIRPRNIDTKYLKYSLQSSLGQQQVSLLQTGGNREGLSAAALSNFKMLLPSLDEQQSIASYLDTKCAEIDALIAIKQTKIEELKDYKKSVIYEYVTGKKEVV